MLKYVFMDVNPYIIDLEKVYELTWKRLIQKLIDEKNTSFSIDGLQNVLNNYPDIIEEKDQWIQQLGEDKYLLLIQMLKSIFLNELNNYVSENPLNPALQTFFSDAEENNTNIILVTSNKLLSGIDKLYKFPKNIKLETIGAKEHLVANHLVEYASVSNLTIDEIACFTQVEETLKNMIDNKIFCITINSANTDKTNENILVLGSLDEITFSNIAYNFYADEKTEHDL